MAARLSTLVVLFSSAIFSLAAEQSAASSHGVEPAFLSRVQGLETVELRTLPTHDSGRLKPLDTLARETLLFITGSRKPFGTDALSFFVGLMTEPEAGRLEIVEVRNVELRKKLNFDSSRRHFSTDELQQSALVGDAGPLIEKQQKNSKSLNEEENSVLEVYQQLMMAQAVVSGQVFLSGIDFSSLQSVGDGGGHAQLSPQLLEKAKAVVGSLSSGRIDGEAVRALDQMVRSQPVPEIFRPHLDKMGTEVLLYRSSIFWIAAIFYILSALMLWRAGQSRTLRLLSQVALGLALFAHLGGFAVRVYITGFAPVTNMYGTMLWVSFGVALFAGILHRFYKRDGLVAILFASAGLVLIIADSFPLILNPGLDPVVAVLRSNLWLTIHVLTITISYAALGITMLLGNYGMLKLAFGQLSDLELKDLAHHSYRMIQLGVFLLTVGIVLGGVWADYSWGRFWGWDPKETWALIADLGYLAILHARIVGWMTPLGMLVAGPLAYLLVVMAWYGVNFVLAAGLHSYGFSKGGAMWVGLFVLAQLSLIGVVAFRHWLRQRSDSAS